MRRRNLVLLALFTFLVSCVGSSALSGNLIETIALVRSYLTYEAVPFGYITHVNLDRKGLLIDDTFTATKDCVYDLNLEMIHSKRGMGEYNHFFVDDRLPVDMELTIYKLNEAGTAPIFHVTRKPGVYAHGLDSTDLKLGSVSLSEGRYRIRLRNMTDLTDLRGIPVRFWVAGGGEKMMCTD